jgi:hypothetical protein
MFRFTYTIIREPQPVFSLNYNAGSNVLFIDVFSVMAAYAAITLNTAVTTSTLEPAL